MATDMAVYFCDLHSAWQRETNESTNGCFRHYFPKGTGLAQYTQDELDDIAAKSNARPRKIFGFMSPAIVFEKALC